MQPALAVTISLGQMVPAVASDMGPRPEQRLVWPGRITNKPVNPGDTAIFDTDADWRLSWADNNSNVLCIPVNDRGVGPPLVDDL